MNRRRVILAVSTVMVLVAAAAGVARSIKHDEILMREVRPGMSERDVAARLGPPDYRFEGITLSSVFLPPKLPCRTRVAVCLAYERHFRKSFFVYLDSSGVVGCTSRMTVHGMTPLV